MLPDALAQALHDAALVLVQAPAGYGKTTSLRAALAGEPNVAWYDAQPWEAGAFVAPLLDRVRAERPDAGRRTLTLAEQGADAEQLGAALSDDLRHVDAPLRIVVDDAHVLGAPFGAFVRSLAKRMPAAVRLVIVTRSPIDAGLPEAVAEGRGALIDASVLRFGVAQARALAREFAAELDDASAAALVERTDGWPIAIALALRAPAASGALLDELVARRVAAFAPDARAVLEATVVYETVEPEIVAPDDAGFAARFAELAADASVVGAVQRGFRVHPLVRETIARRLDDAVLAERHAEAARAYAAAGRLRPALFHLERAHAPSADAAFLRAHAAAALASGLNEGVRAALGRVRASGDAPPALLALVDALLAKARGDDARPAFSAAELAADAADDAEIAFAARLQSIEAELAHGEATDPARIEDLLRRAEPHGAAARTMAVVRAGWADAVRGDFRRALARLDVLAASNADAVTLADVAPLEAYANLALGDFDAAERVANALVESWSARDDLVRYSGALVWSARFALLRGDAIAAYELAIEAERIARPFALRAQAAALHATLAEAALDAGDTGVARRAARAALRTSDAAWYARDAARARTLGARILARADALDGDLRAALTATGDEDPIASADGALFATLGGRSDAQARRDRARAKLAHTHPIDGADAVALWAAADALDRLDARAGRDVRTSLDHGPFEALVARRAEAPGISFEAHLIERWTSGQPRAAARTPFDQPVEALTAREHEILELLAAGLTNREIAQRLVLSARTVETHVARITGKLGVNTRARAVARAVALGVVAPPAA